jgi:DNA ligase-1
MSQMTLPMIFKMDTAGKIRSWEIEIVGDSYRTHAGIHQGNPVTSGWSKCTAASQETDEAQAIFEATAQRNKKLDREYYPTLKQAQSGVAAMFKPMLAKDFTKEGKKVAAFVAKGGRLYVQPKLDGMRCIFTKDGAKTRQNQDIKSVAHIEKHLQAFFAEFPDAILDGELYNHDLKDDFQTIMSMARREDFTDAEREKCERLIQYHVYDVCMPGVFGDRLSWLNQNSLHANLVQIVPTYLVQVEDFAASIEIRHQDFLQDGYEGTIVRLDGEYENTRSSSLLKYKVFDTAEFILLSVEEGNGNWAGYAKKAYIGRLDGKPWLDKDGKVDDCKAGIRGTQADMLELLQNAEKSEGSEVTVRFFGKTDTGKPRFGVIVDLHKGKRKD